MLHTIANKISNFKKKYKNMNVAIKAGLWFTICSIIQRGLSVITLPIFTRLMSTEEYGTYSIFFTWYSILQLIVTMNIQSEIFNKGLIEHIEEKDAFTVNQAGLLIFLNVLFLLVYIALSRFLTPLINISLPLMIIMFFEILGSAELSLWYARKRFDYDYVKLVIMTVSVTLVTPIIGIVAVCLSSYKAEAKIISNAAVPILVSIFLVIGYSKKEKLFCHKDWWKKVVLASLPLIPHYLSLVLLNQSDKLMIDFFWGKEETALYSVAHSAGLLMTIINSSINGSFVPWEYNQLKYKNGEGIAKTANALMGIVLFVNAALIWVAPEAIKLLAANQYAESVWCLVPIAMSVFFYFVYTLFVNVEIYYGANKFVAIASFFAALLNIVLNYICIPIFGYFAAGYTTLISYFVTMLLHYVFMKITLRKHGQSSVLYDIKTLVVLSVVLWLLSALAMVLYPYALIRWAIIVATLVIVIIKRKKILMLLKKLKNKTESF